MNVAIQSDCDEYVEEKTETRRGDELLSLFSLLRVFFIVFSLSNTSCSDLSPHDVPPLLIFYFYRRCNQTIMSYNRSMSCFSFFINKLYIYFFFSIIFCGISLGSCLSARVCYILIQVCVLQMKSSKYATSFQKEAT